MKKDLRGEKGYEGGSEKVEMGEGGLKILEG